MDGLGLLMNQGVKVTWTFIKNGLDSTKIQIVLDITPSSFFLLRYFSCLFHSNVQKTFEYYAVRKYILCVFVQESFAKGPRFKKLDLSGMLYSYVVLSEKL